jgi:nucleoid-associated protein YgaU
MARKKSQKSAKKEITVEERPKGLLERFNLKESYTSLILGAIVVLVVGILIFSFIQGNRGSVNQDPEGASDTSSDQTSSTYTVKPGDDLWSIAEDVYDDGYKWTDIAKANNLSDPGVIETGDELKIPKLEKVDEADETEDNAEEVDEVEEVDEEVEEEASIVIAEKEESSKTENESMEQEDIDMAITGDAYTVQKGDSLWKIAVRAYGDGFKWVEIARTNELENPDLIHPDNELTLPR